MSTILITGYNEAMREIGSLTSPLMAAYADSFDMDFLRVREYHAGCHPSWQKAEHVQAALERGYDCVLWLDADTVITNPKFIPSPSKDETSITASKDWGTDACEPWHFSLGNFIAQRRGGWRFMWGCISAACANGQDYHLWEQSAMQEFYRGSSTRRHMFNIRSRREFNAVHAELAPSAPDPWQPGDWLCHLTGEEITNEKRVAMFHKLKEELGL